MKLRLTEKNSQRSSRVQSARVVGVTTASCLSAHLDSYKPTLLILDEAAQITECASHLAIARLVRNGYATKISLPRLFFGPELSGMFLKRRFFLQKNYCCVDVRIILSLCWKN